MAFFFGLPAGRHGEPEEAARRTTGRTWRQHFCCRFHTAISENIARPGLGVGEYGDGGAVSPLQ